MDIGTNIRSYRTQMGITQGELAEMLCVSHQTVSKWERQIIYPDISVLPKLASVFQISIDNLLNFNISETQKYIAEIKEKLHDLNKAGDLLAQKSILETAIQKYPHEPYFIERLLNVCIPLSQKGELSEIDFLRIKNIGDRYIGDLKSRNFSDSILRALTLLCAEFEQYSAESMVYYRKLPSLRNIQSNIAHFILPKQEYAALAPNIILDHIYYAALLCRNLALKIDDKAEKIQNLEASNKMIENIFLDENYGYFSTVLVKNHYDLSMIYLNQSETLFLDHMKKCLQTARHYNTFAYGNYRTVFGNIAYDKSVYYDKQDYFSKYKEKYSEHKAVSQKEIFLEICSNI